MTQAEGDKIKDQLLEELVRLSNDVQVRRRELDELFKSEAAYLERRRLEEETSLAAIKADQEAALVYMARLVDLIVRVREETAAARVTTEARRLELETAFAALKRAQEEFAAFRARKTDEFSIKRKAMEEGLAKIEEIAKALEEERARLPKMPGSVTIGLNLN